MDILDNALDLLILFGLGVAGILIHSFIKLNEINKKTEGHANIYKYWMLEKYAILVSFMAVIISLFIVEELNQLESFVKWKGLGFVAIGYMGQSIVIWAMGKAGNAVGKPTDNENNN